jgi:hypothetical protein
MGRPIAADTKEGSAASLFGHRPGPRAAETVLRPSRSFAIEILDAPQPNFRERGELIRKPAEDYKQGTRLRRDRPELRTRELKPTDLR